MNTRMRVFATLSLILVCRHAAAIPELRVVTPTFNQTGANSGLNVGLLIEAATSLPVLVIGGGFTITCTSSTLQQTAERRATYSAFLGPHEVLRIPEVVPSVYPIPGWSNLPFGACTQCIMQYKAEVRDETTLSIRVGSTGVGANFTLIPAGEQSKSDSILTDACRLRQKQCCTPPCAIP
jgi:hypothetical protein